MVTKVLKLVGIIVASLVIVALVLTAVNMDVDTGFVAAGKKWINNFTEITTGKQAFIEEYIADTDEVTADNETEKASVEETEEFNAPANTTSTLVDENASSSDEELDEQRAIVYGEKSGISMITDDDPVAGISGREGRTTTNKAQNLDDFTSESNQDVQGDTDELPKTYDEFTMLSLEEKNAIAEYLGDDYDAWVKQLEAHQDDGYIIISAGDSVEELE